MESNHRCLRVILAQANLYWYIHLVRLMLLNSLMAGLHKKDTFLVNK